MLEAHESLIRGGALSTAIEGQTKHQGAWEPRDGLTFRVEIYGTGQSTCQLQRVWGIQRQGEDGKSSPWWREHTAARPVLWYSVASFPDLDPNR